MEVDPEMCMKTKETLTKWPPKSRTFTAKWSDLAEICRFADPNYPSIAPSTRVLLGKAPYLRGRVKVKGKG